MFTGSELGLHIIEETKWSMQFFLTMISNRKTIKLY